MHNCSRVAVAGAARSHEKRGDIDMNPKKTLVCAGFICLAAAPLALLAQDEEEVLEFEEAEVFFELNNTDGDLGIHALIDGGPWKLLEIRDVDDRSMLTVNARGRVRQQGMTEIFFESAEPTFDVLPPAEFFNRFPEGTGTGARSFPRKTGRTPAHRRQVAVLQALYHADKSPSRPAPGVLILDGETQQFRSQPTILRQSVRSIAGGSLRSGRPYVAEHRDVRRRAFRPE
jgi:hypothetical protein